MFQRFFLLAIVFLASCSVPERDNPLDPDGVNYIGGGGEVEPRSSSSFRYSSSNGVAISSSSNIITQTSPIYGPSIEYGDEIYQSVVIGKQIWLNRNLNYEVEGSQCYSNSQFYCDIYGRLYDWPAAMDLPVKCGDESCGSLINAKHKGICPSGWHIPSNADWNELLYYIDGISGNTNNLNSYSSKTAGPYLKTIGGWTKLDFTSGNGTDNFGFSALPAGYCYTINGCGYIGSNSFLWSSAEAYLSVDKAVHRDIGENSSDWEGNGVTAGQVSKWNKNSVRCLKDDFVMDFSSSSTPSSSSAPHCDLNGETVNIGGQVWMAENLNCNVKGSMCYGSAPENCEFYGRLYDWSTAMALPNCNDRTCASQINAKHQGICPDGWHIPSKAEWNALMWYAEPSCESDSYCKTAGTKLKSENLWNLYEKIPIGTDDYGFSALPGGGAGLTSGFSSLRERGNWWSASEDAINMAFILDLTYNYESVSLNKGTKSAYSSVRCVQN